MRKNRKDDSRRRLYHTFHKLKRSFTAFLPVDNNRRGQCNRCGVCCTMGWTCPFLKYVRENGETLAACGIRHIRPMNCRTYPTIVSLGVVSLLFSVAIGSVLPCASLKLVGNRTCSTEAME